MKIKVDEDLPESLVEKLNRLGHEVDCVRIEGLAGRSDSEVLIGTQAAGRFLLTQELDSSDLQRHAPETHQGILIARVPHAGSA